jgi:hypothetical protein
MFRAPLFLVVLSAFGWSSVASARPVAPHTVLVCAGSGFQLTIQMLANQTLEAVVVFAQKPPYHYPIAAEPETTADAGTIYYDGIQGATGNIVISIFGTDGKTGTTGNLWIPQLQTNEDISGCHS